AAWSPSEGLCVDRSVRVLSPLPALRVRAATPRAAEWLLHQRFPRSHGCLELQVHRFIGSACPSTGAVAAADLGEAVELFTARLPFVWGAQ
ncbi:unnamed protein product, partial [Prorocentrum cordatum]